MSSPKLRVIFRPKSEIQMLFSPKIRWSPKKKKTKGFHQNWEWFFGRNRKFRRLFRPKSGGPPPKKKEKKLFTKIENDFSAEIGNSNVFFAQNQMVSKKKKKKKKKVFTEIEVNFSAGILRLRLVGGNASRNGAELFEIEADFSAKIVTIRLVGGCIPPIPPPKSATEQWPYQATSITKIVRAVFFQTAFFRY